VDTDIWFTIVSIFYVLVCAFLILVVLLQQGKGGGMGAAFGGGGTNTVFGGAGAGNFLTRLTAICAVLFMVLSAVLAYLSSSGDRAMEAADAIEREANEEEEDTVAPEGGTPDVDGTAPPPPASLDTPEEAAGDPVIDALEQEAERLANEPSPEAAPEPEPAPEPAPEAAPEPEPEAAEEPAPTKAPRPRRPRPAPAAEGEAPEAAPAPAAEPAPAEATE
jgi:preprotein translocase subunit SecG